MFADKDANQAHHLISQSADSDQDSLLVQVKGLFSACFCRLQKISGPNPIVPVLHFLSSFHRSALSLKLDWTTLEFN